MIIGKCSICGGPVSESSGLPYPIRKCDKCGATAKDNFWDNLPEIPMEPAPEYPKPEWPVVRPWPRTHPFGPWEITW